MYRVFLALLASILLSILLMTACIPSVPGVAPSVRLEPSESTDPCAAIASATSVQVLLPPGAALVGKSAYRLTDPDAVRRLVAFVNLRRIVSPPGADTPPYPKLKTTFYKGNRHVAIFGSGEGFFYLQCGTVRGARYASAAEITEFQMLIAPPSAP